MHRDLVYSVEAGADGVGDLSLPDTVTPDTPVVLQIHGGGWSAGDRYSWSGVADFFRKELGFAAFNIEYRLTKKGPWPLCGNDCIAAARYLLSDPFKKRFGLNVKRIWICGGSAGGHLALWTGLSLPPEQVAGIVSISGIGDLAPDERAHPGRYVSLFGRKPSAEELRAASPRSLLTPRSPRIFCSHATVDGAAPFDASRLFVEACRAEKVPTEFFTYEKRDGGHSIWIPGSKPHKLLPDIETAIKRFVGDSGEKAVR
ncbi:MAG: alpha/beta hydrolase [Kiritimatiellia bacterium]|nr:alpha/beta hydrolase [Kiritimatiellia bacterium]